MKISMSSELMTRFMACDAGRRCRLVECDMRDECGRMREMLEHIRAQDAQLEALRESERVMREAWQDFSAVVLGGLTPFEFGIRMEGLGAVAKEWDNWLHAIVKAFDRTRATLEATPPEETGGER